MILIYEITHHKEVEWVKCILKLSHVPGVVVVVVGAAVVVSKRCSVKM